MGYDDMSIYNVTLVYIIVYLTKNHEMMNVDVTINHGMDVKFCIFKAYQKCVKH